MSDSHPPGNNQVPVKVLIAVDQFPAEETRLGADADEIERDHLQRERVGLSWQRREKHAETETDVE